MKTLNKGIRLQSLVPMTFMFRDGNYALGVSEATTLNAYVAADVPLIGT